MTFDTKHRNSAFAFENIDTYCVHLTSLLFGYVFLSSKIVTLSPKIKPSVSAKV